MTRIAVIVIVSGGTLLAQAQPPRATPTPASPRAIVEGRVVTDDTGDPIRNARVTLTPPEQGTPVVLTDVDGRFSLTAPSGRYRVVASKTGYSRRDMTPMSVETIDIRLQRGAAVSGRVVDEFGDPVRARVVAETWSGSPTAVATEAAASSTYYVGEYRLAGLSSEQPVDLTEGETREGLTLNLARWGTLAGDVFDELGDPLEGASVHLLQVRYEAGRRRLVDGGPAARLTDDLGRYRLYGIPPGQCVVSAVVGAVSSTDIPGYGRAYFPSTPNPGEAQFVSLGPSQDITGVDISLSRTPTARVAGQLLNAAGAPTTAGSLRLLASQRSTSVISVPVGARIFDDGAFEFPNVPAGQYVIQADRGTQNASTEGEFGTLPVTVDTSDVTDLVLQTSSGSTITGRFTFDAYHNSPTPSPSTIDLSPVPVDVDLAPAHPATADVRPDWTFTMAGIHGPRRLEVRRVPSGWALKEILVHDIDVTDRPLPFGRRDQSLTDVEVVLTDRINEVSGTIADDDGRLVPGASVIFFSTDRDRWPVASRYVRKAVAGSDGRFTIAGLPSGGYYARALARLPADGADAWLDPEFLDSLVPAASLVTLEDGQTQALNLQLITR
jgi:protocatechuate 3,4-dioxygenase beta subunit